MATATQKPLSKVIGAGMRVTHPSLMRVLIKDLLGRTSQTKNSRAHLDGAIAWISRAQDACGGRGVSAGVRFDDLSLVEFRWTRATSALRFGTPFAFLGSSIGDVTLNQFHADFTREWVLPQVKGLRSFLTGSVGLTHLGAANDAFTRFSFGFGAGLKQFLSSRFAIRGEALWLPIVVEPSVSGFACGTIQFGGCLVVLNGELVQQFQLSIGPVVRF